MSNETETIEEKASYYTLYDSESGNYVSNENLKISDEEYDSLIMESLTCGAMEGHVMCGDRRVYAAE